MCRIFKGPSSSCGIPCEAAYLVLACSTCGLTGLRWGGGLVVRLLLWEGGGEFTVGIARSEPDGTR